MNGGTLTQTNEKKNKQKQNEKRQNTNKLMHCHRGTNNRAPQWTFTEPCKPEVEEENIMR